MPKTSVGESFTLAIISGIEKVLIRGGSITIFRRSFCLTVPKDNIGEHFGVPEKAFYRKISCIRGGRSITVLSNFFVSQDANEKLCKGTLCFPEVFWYRKKVMEKKGLSRFSVENFMSDSAENARDRILLFYCFWEVWFQIVLWMKRRYHVFQSESFGLTLPKTFVR